MIPLDYHTPKPPKKMNPIWPAIRFAAGLAVVLFPEEIVQNQSHPVIESERAWGPVLVSIPILFCCGLLLLGWVIRDLICKHRLRERSNWLTMAVGIVLLPANLLILNGGEYLFGDNFTFCVIILLPASMIGSAWLVFGTSTEILR
jgi:hypothetical protein